MATDPAYRRRERAESFGAVAANYDRYRPSYPAELIDDLVALAPAGSIPEVLDVGTGTGIAARLLAAHGLHVLGLEPDPQMATVARGRGLDVEVSGFERWDPRGRTFDLITCAQAWHWIEPAAGAAQAARLLRPGGALALFWNYDHLDAATTAAVNAVYGRLAPQLTSLGDVQRLEERGYADGLRGHFAAVESRTYPWQRTESVDDWVARVGTHSDHLLLGTQRLATVQAALRSALLELGDSVRLTGGTYLILARRS